MLNMLSSFGASTTFEKHRLEATRCGLQAPNEQSLKNLMKTFYGDDNQTRSQFAFATIIKKTLTSDSKKNWTYLLKNLIIFDRIVEQNLYAEQVAGMTLSTVQNYRQTDMKYINWGSQRLVKGFWKLIKSKAHVLSSRKHIFCFKRNQRTQFLAKLGVVETLAQLASVENFFAQIFEFIDVMNGKQSDQDGIEDNRNRKLKPSQSTSNLDTRNKVIKGQPQFCRTKLGQFIFLQLLHKLMLYYSCQLQCNNRFIELVLKSQCEAVKTEQLRRFKKYLLKFKVNSNEYIKFVQARKTIKGFDQLNYKQLNPFQDEDVIKLIDECIRQSIVQNQQSHPVQKLVIDRQMLITIDKKPNLRVSRNVLIPRIKSSKVQVSENEYAAFRNWVNSYSSEFPQKEIMTVDLILELKREQSNTNSVMDDPIIYSQQRETVIMQSRNSQFRSENVLSCRNQSQGQSGWQNFKDVFSTVPQRWNQ